MINPTSIQLDFIECRATYEEFLSLTGDTPAPDLWAEREHWIRSHGHRESKSPRFDVRLPLGDDGRMYSLCKCETFDALSAVLLAVLVKAEDGPKRLEIQVF